MALSDVVIEGIFGGKEFVFFGCFGEDTLCLIDDENVAILVENGNAADRVHGGIRKGTKENGGREKPK